MKKLFSLNEGYLNLRPRKITGVITLFILSLTLISIVLAFIKYYMGVESLIVHYLLMLFYLDKENNVPTYLSSILLLAAALLLLYIFAGKYLKKDSYKYYWGLLSGLFLLVSMDEYMSLHERMMDPLRSFIEPSGWFYFTWVIPAIIAVCIGALLSLKFILSLRFPIRMMFILSAVIYLGGAIGFEMVGGYVISNFGSENFLFAMTSNIEETLEMLGVAYFIYALLVYIQTDLNQKLRISILSPATKVSTPRNAGTAKNRGAAKSRKNQLHIDKKRAANFRQDEKPQ